MKVWLAALTLSIAAACGSTDGGTQPEATEVGPTGTDPDDAGEVRDPSPTNNGNPAKPTMPDDPTPDVPIGDPPPEPIPSFGEWYRGVGSAGPEAATALATDADGNVYIAGSFDDQVTIGGQTVTAIPGEYEPRPDVFVASFGPTGDFRWIRSYGGPDADLPFSVVVDAQSNVYVVGFNQSDVNFPSAVLVGKGSEDVHIVSYDTDGTFRWAESFGGPYGESPRKAAINDAGKLVITGSYQGLFSAGAYTLSSLDEWAAMEVFTLRYDVNTREVDWATGFQGFLIDTGTAVDIAEDGSVVVGVSLQYDLNITPQTTFSSDSDFFNAGLVKLDDAGRVAWALELGGDGDMSEEVLGVALAADGSVFATGVFEDEVSLGDITLRNAASRAHDTWVARLSADGDVVWARSYGAAGFDQPLGLATKGDSVYVAGRFDDTITFGSYDLEAVADGYDIFLASFSSVDGGAQWARSFGSDGNDQPAGIVADAGRGLYVAGYASGAFMFNDALQPAAGDLIDAFVLRVEE